MTKRDDWLAIPPQKPHHLLLEKYVHMYIAWNTELGREPTTSECFWDELIDPGLPVTCRTCLFLLLVPIGCLLYPVFRANRSTPLSHAWREAPFCVQVFKYHTSMFSLGKRGSDVS